MEALEKLSSRNGYKELVAYIEACESGSMFTGFQEQLHSIYVSTASNDVESSWGTYCPGKGGGIPVAGRVHYAVEHLGRGGGTRALG